MRYKFVLLGLLGGLLPAQAAVFDVTAFGAKGDGKTLDRDAINKAIEAAAAAGGGTVYFPPGTYLTGSIQLHSNLTLQLERGATIEAVGRCRRPTIRRAQPVEQVPGFRPQPLAQQPDLGRRHREHRDRGRRADLGQRAGPRQRHGRGRQGDRAQALPQRDAARFFDPERRPLRHSGHGRRQPDHRQREDRHQSRRHRRGRLPQCAHLEFQRELAERRCHRAEGDAMRWGRRGPPRP